MKTQRLVVDPRQLETQQARQALDAAAAILRAGGLVALPTETVYGLGANALNRAAVERIFAAKRRPAWDPVIVHIARPHGGRSMLDELVVEVPPAARKLMDAFWPGPLTLLLPRSASVPDLVTAGRPLVGVRIPAHPVALELICRAGVPVAAPSANLFGHISPTTADHVLEDLDGRIDAVLDAGPTQHGVESTVVDPCQNPIVIYRPGAITASEIRNAAGPVELYSTAEPIVETPQSALPSPGVGLRHYAPRAKLVLVPSECDDPEALSLRIAEAASAWRGQRLGILLPADVPLKLDGVFIHPWGRWSAPEELAHGLYAGLRALDALGCTVILCPQPSADGIGAAILDRLSKAALR